MILDSLINPIATILDKVIVDKDERLRLSHEIATLAERQAHEVALAQIEVNKTEAQSASNFRAGWRPFIGWVCGTAFAYHFVLQPFMIFGLNVFEVNIEPLPELDMAALLTVLGGLLGLGGLRTVEKMNGIS